MAALVQKQNRMKRMTRNERRYYRKKLTEQRLMGLAIILCCVLMLWLCSTGTTPADRDGTAIVLLAPMGIWMLVTKQIVIY